MRLIQLLTFLPFAAFTKETFGTHVLGGEIRYSHLSGTTYTIEVLIWSDLNSPADRPEIMVDFGDGTQDTVPRTSITDDPIGTCSPIRHSIYATTHTYTGSGVYDIRHTDMNRSGGIVNIPNSNMQPFSIAAVLSIFPAIGGNSSARFETSQPMTSWNWSTLIHDLQATDPDGDSLSFQLVAPVNADGLPMGGYQSLEMFTSAGGFHWLDPMTGVFLWDHPTLIGTYVISIRCNEWRNGEIIGLIHRDMTICVSELPTAVEDGSTSTEDVQLLRLNDEWILVNNTQGILIGELIDARGALIQRINLPGGRTVVPLTDRKSLVLLSATDAEGRQRIFKLTP